jgi:hypothetical protein
MEVSEDIRSEMQELGIIQVDIGDGPVQINLDEYVPIDGTILSLEFVQHATKYAYLAMLCSRAEAMYMAAKQKADDDEKVAYLTVKNTAVKVTDETAKCFAATDAQVLTSKDAELYYRAQYSLLKSVVDAMYHRKDMLISLGAQSRAEGSMSGAMINTDVGEAARKVIRSLNANP